MIDNQLSFESYLPRVVVQYFGLLLFVVRLNTGLVSLMGKVQNLYLSKDGIVRMGSPIAGF